MAASCDNLIIWLNTFENPEPIKSIQDLSNGVILSKILRDICPEVFSDDWQARIKADSSGNWRIRASNLKKVLKGMLDYYSQELQLTLPDAHLPDVNVIAEKEDKREMGKLLQLLIGCAVNCNRKQEYIQRIMSLEESVQHSVMLSIKQLMLTESSQPADDEFSQEIPTAAEFRSLQEERDTLEQRCHGLDQQLLVLSDEKQTLRAENERLNQRLNQVDILEDPSTPLGRRLQQLQKQAEQSQEELFKSEAVKDDYRIKCELLEKEVKQLQAKVEMLTELTEESRSIKDELDVLRHNSDKVARYEVTISNLRKKLDDLSDLKGQLKMLEEKNTSYVERNLELEEELKKASVLKSQLEVYKRQAQDLQLRASEEGKKMDKYEFDLARCQEKVIGLQKEKERLVQERDSLKEMNEDLKLMHSSLTASQLPSMEGEGDGLELMSAPPQIREKLIKLQHELKMLKLSSHVSPEELEVYKNLLEDANVRKDDLELELRAQNRKIMELEARIEDMAELNKADSTLRPTQPSSTSPTSTASLTSQSPPLTQAMEPAYERSDELKNCEDMKVVQALAEVNKKLQEKEEEMKTMEQKYKQYLEKAKMLINHHIQKGTSLPDVAVLEERLAERENYITVLENQLKASEAEEKLMLSAFYNLSMNLHRKNVEERLSKGFSSVPHSFLSRQRQVQSRRASSGAPTSPHVR